MSERCCGTCDRTIPHELDCMVICTAPIPACVFSDESTMRMMFKDDADSAMCQCWTPKEPTQEGKP